MKPNNFLLIVVLMAAAFFFSCNSDFGTQEITKSITYDNISIYSDLSNRLNHSPNDSLIIEQIITYFIESCVKPGIKINDRSALSFSKLNSFNSQCTNAIIDLNEFDDLVSKQKFVNNTSEYNLDAAIAEFKSSVSCSYRNRDKRGLDVISLLAYEIENGNCFKESMIIPGEYDTTYFHFRNHIFLFTDGYLEFVPKYGNNDYYFGYREIRKLRSALKESGGSDIVQFLNDNPEYAIPAINNPNNRFIDLYILETYDRGINKKYGTIRNAGPFSDNNILKAVWEHWASKSEFKSITWRMMTTQNSISNDYIKTMLAASKNEN